MCWGPRGSSSALDLRGSARFDRALELTSGASDPLRAAQLQAGRTLWFFSALQPVLDSSGLLLFFLRFSSPKRNGRVGANALEARFGI